MTDRRGRGASLVAALLAAVAALATLVATAPSASAAPTTVRFVTANLDFTLSQQEVAEDWRATIAPNADVVLIQEAKNVNLRDFINTDNWRVLHMTERPDRKGSALVLRRSAVRAVQGWDLVRGVEATRCTEDRGIDTRWIAKAQVQLTNGRWIRVASVHLPPGYCQTGPGSSYDRMIDSVVGFANRTDMPTVIGGDWNKVVDHDPNEVGARTGLRPNGPNEGWRIDGFLYTRGFGTTDPRHLAKGNSDHRPVRMDITFPASAGS